jgi:hypothetical protein
MDKDKIESYKNLSSTESPKNKRKKSKENIEFFPSKKESELISLKESKKKLKKEQKQNLLQLNSPNAELEDLPIEKDTGINIPSNNNNNINPCHLGNLKSFCINKKKGIPLRAIGPQCKKIILIKFI